jgi:large subunit ribosomal protein L9
MIKQRQFTLEEKHKEKLRYISEKIARISVDLVVEVDEEDRLFGTVSPAQIAEALEKQGYSISKKQIIISDPIDSLGVYNVRVQLHPDIESKVRVWVLKREK